MRVAIESAARADHCQRSRSALGTACSYVFAPIGNFSAHCLLAGNVKECRMIRYWRTIAVSFAAVLTVVPVGIVRAEPPDKPVKSSAANCARPDFRVVLDVGHTAKSPGAKSARGADEFDFNLRLANQIDQALLEAGFAKTVLMVTAGPGTRSLYARVARANELSANLLLSIHHDSVPDRFLEKWDYNGKPKTFSDRFKGHSIFVSDGNLDSKDSLLFASMLGQQLKVRGLQYTPHYSESFMGRWQRALLDADAGVYRYDTLFVLKNTQMPAVLLEAGSIANRDEELVMASPERQQLISTAVVDAVDSFCATQSRKPALQMAQHSKARHVLSAHSRRARERPATPLTPVSVSNFDIH
jgi:N-acetylmuramoyl-L-alanine amidase